MTTKKDKRVYAEERHPKALGKYIDLICINGLTTAKAYDFISHTWGAEAARWCVEVCGDRKPHRDEDR